MKKVVKLLLIAVLALSAVLGLVACGGDSGETGEKGIICRKFKNDNFYTVVGYGAEEGEDPTLDIEVAVKAKYGETAIVGRIRTGAFDGNKTLKSVIVSDKAGDDVDLTIDAGAFKNMRALEEITLPFVGANRFSDADMNGSAPASGDGLKAVNEQRSFGYIFGTEESDAASKITLTYGDVSEQTADFYIPVALIKINIVAEEDINIPMYAFCGLKRIEEITLSGNIKAIGRSAFKNMDKLSKINIPSSVETIYDNAFEGTTSLKVFGDNGFKIDENSNLTDIRKEAFKETKLKNFDLSGTQVKTIGAWCFYNSALETFTFSADIESVGAYAFANSSNLAVEQPSCAIGTNAFADIKAFII